MSLLLKRPAQVSLRIVVMWLGRATLSKHFNGTQPYMTPEMFTSRPYTAATDPWALGMVVARYLSRGRPGA